MDTTTTADAQPQGLSSWAHKQIDELFLVLATMGQRLLALEVINRESLFEARTAVRGAHRLTDSSNDYIGKEFDLLPDTIQFSVTCAAVFCAECWPMHMYRGFGCGVLDDVVWASIKDDNWVFRDMDKMLAYLKGTVHSWELLTKRPEGIDQYQPDWRATDKKALQKTIKKLATLHKAYEKYGHPQQNEWRHDKWRFNTWSVPFAAWNVTPLFYDVGHDFELNLIWQQDPGRYLYAWTVLRRLDVKPGVAVEISYSEVVQSLAIWLEGLQGMTHRVLSDSQLNYAKLNSGWTFTYEPTYDLPKIIVRDPDRAQAVEAAAAAAKAAAAAPASPVSTDAAADSLGRLNLSPTSTTSSGQRPASPLGSPASSSSTVPTMASTATKRRKAPPPPPVQKFHRAIAKHDFEPEAGSDEMALKKGELVDRVDGPEDAEGWVKAKKDDGTEGVVPSTYLIKFGVSDSARSEARSLGMI